ncbi:nucleotidyltransferase family protein [Methyloligella solikamskensis]|uniref:Nucleotidyltransferase family protein n=1 Tax=Methyloligella solikamskensis TaxID=1177756 RepID=A0ABW3J8R1_9HYPH
MLILDLQEVTRRIRSREQDIRGYGAAALFLYGSTRHGRAGPDSDVDIFIDRDPERPFGFMQFTGLEQYLSGLLETEVDLSTRTALHPMLRSTIEHDAIRIL